MQATSTAAEATKSLLPITKTSRIISPTTNPVKPTSSSSVATPTEAAAPISKNSANTSAKRTAENDPNCEIEEISKKISEHADAIYRTWKCRGLVPAELLNLYTSAAAIETVAGNTAPDFFAASNAVVADDASSEGLQQLVKTFVINDKQQRSAKSNTMSNTKSHNNNNNGNTTIINRSGACINPELASATGGNSGKHKKSLNTATTTTTTPKVDAGLKIQTGNVLKQPKPSTQFTPAILLPEKTTTLLGVTPLTTSSTTAATTVTAKAASKVRDDKSSIVSATTTKTTTSNLSPVQNRNACASDKHLQEESTGKTLRKQQQQQQQQQQHFQCAGNNHKHTNDIEDATLQNIDLASLNLNVNDLMQLQSQNLMKIKDLLQEKSVAATAEKTKKISKGLTAPRENNGKRTTLNENCIKNATTGTMIPMMMATTTATAAALLTTTAMTMSTPITTITAAAQRSPSVVMSNHDKAKIAVGNDADVVVGSLIDKNSNITKKTKNATNAATSPILAANKTLPTNQQTAAINAIFLSNANEKRVKTRIDEMKIEGNKTIKMTNTNSSSSNGNNSNSNSNKSDSSNMSDFIRSDSKNKSNNNNNSNSDNSDNNDSNRSNNNSSKILREKATSASVKNTSKELAIVSNIPTAVTTAAAAPTTTTTPIAAITTTTTTTVTTTTSPPTTILASGGATSLTVSENGTEVARASMPAPAKVKTSRLVSTGQDKNLGRPILTRGSVAERVLMFEKCPDVRQSFLNIKRPDPADAPPRTLLKVKLHANPPPPSEQNLLQKEIRTSGRSIYIPRFYFPHGKPQPQIAIERTLRGILSAFDSFPNNQVTKDELPRILKLCGLPYYWRMPVMIFCQHGQSGLVERQRYLEFWKQMNVYCHDNASRFVYILSRGQRFRSYILPEDLAPLVQDVVDTHPGLAFLKEATEFHSRYVHTVIARIFYSVNRSWSGKISISELKRSDLLEIIALLEEEDDINQIMAFFSYEHFYVIYCKFWELDRDHDLLINQDDLARYSDHALSSRIIERIFSGCVTRNDNRKDPDDEPKMSYTDFVWFLLSEEDKRTPTAIEYWFRCMDMDGDGLVSMYELEYFYEEQQQRMESIGIETLPFEDCLCQMLDMIKPQNRDCITLGDLKRCKMTHVFFDTFFNLEKYLDHEQRDPFASQRDEYTSDWDRFAAQEYELLITEENE